MTTRAACFVEKDPDASLRRRALVEGVGTLLLILAVTGSGLIALHLQDTPLLARTANAVATAAALVGLIVAFGAVSGGHFNPLVTTLQWASRERRLDCAVAYVAAQAAGAVGGALLANLIFGVQSRSVPPPHGLVQLGLSKLLATAALMIVVFGCIRSGRTQTGPFAVGAWLTAAIIATPSGSYANPAIVLAALFVDGPVALAAKPALVYVLLQVGGAFIALLIISIAYPRHGADAPRSAKPLDVPQYPFSSRHT